MRPDAALTSGSFSGSVDCVGMNDGLRARLKRIAKEITARGRGYTDRKPPPVSVVRLMLRMTMFYLD